MIKMKCGKCGHKWPYKGKSKHYATCPDCKTSVKINSENKMTPWKKHPAEEEQ